MEIENAFPAEKGLSAIVQSDEEELIFQEYFIQYESMIMRKYRQQSYQGYIQ